MINAQFSTTLQKRSDIRHPQKSIQTMFDMINNQPFYLNIDLIQTSFNCSDDQIFVQQFLGSIITQLPILSCQTSQKESILSLIIPLPTHNIDLTLVLAGIKTIGAISIGLNGPSAISEDNRLVFIEISEANFKK
jgi:hypothetical protein